jgi:hypothetical protein
MTCDDALEALRTHIAPGRAEQMAAYHKQSREVLGVSNVALNDLAKSWRQQLDLDARVSLAAELWQSNKTRPFGSC